MLLLNINVNKMLMAAIVCVCVAMPWSGQAATVSWVTDANGSWHTATNWSSNPLLPGALDDVVVDVGGATVRTITHSQGTDSIQSLSSEEIIQVTGGSLSVSGNVQVNNTFTLNGGSILKATISAGTGGQGLTLGTSSSNKMVGTTVYANMDLTQSGAKVKIENGLTLNGTASVTGQSEMVFMTTASQTLGGSGSLVFAYGNTYTPGLWIDGTTTLIIGPNFTIRGYGSIGQSRYVTGTDTLMNDGTIQAGSGGFITVRADLFTNRGIVEARDGGALTINSPNWSNSGTLRAINTNSNLYLQNNWSNTGTIEVTNATVNLQGSLTTAGLGSFDRSGGTIKLGTASVAATLDNTGATLDLDAIGMGNLSIENGTINGGTITASSGSDLIPLSNTNNRLVGATVNADLNLSQSGGKIKIENGLTLNGTATVNGLSEIVFTTTASQALGGSGELVLTWADGWTPGLWIDGNTTVTIEPNFTIRGYGNVGQSRYIAGTDTLINQGTIRAGTGNLLTLRPDILNNQGTIEATGGGTVSYSGSTSFSNSGILTVAASSTLNLNGGTVTLASNGVLTGAGSVSGSVSNTNGVVRPGTTIGRLTITGGYSQGINGTLEIQINSTSSYDSLAATGSINLGGVSQGGTLRVTLTGSSLQNGNTFDILDFSSITGTFTTLELASPGTGLEWNLANLYTNGTITVNASAAAPTITAWRTERTQGSIGNLSITLNPGKTSADTGSNGPVCETRLRGLQQLIVDFSGPVQAADNSLDAGDVTVTDSNSVSYTPTSVALTEGNTRLLVNFNEGVLPNGKRYTFNLAGKFKSATKGQPVEGDTDCQVRCLIGDVNMDGTVNLVDIGAVKLRNRQTVTQANAAFDTSADGLINLLDVALTKSLSGSSAP